MFGGLSLWLLFICMFFFLWVLGVPCPWNIDHCSVHLFYKLQKVSLLLKVTKSRRVCPCWTQLPESGLGEGVWGAWVTTRDSLKEKPASLFCAVNAVDELQISIFWVLFRSSLHGAQHLEAVSSHLLVLPHVLESNKTGCRTRLFSTDRLYTTLLICLASLGPCCLRFLRLRWAGVPLEAVYGRHVQQCLLSLQSPGSWLLGCSRGAPYWQAFFKMNFKFYCTNKI